MTALARSQDLRAEMEADNLRWLAAYDGNDLAAFSALYALDDVLLAPDLQTTKGRTAIRHYWAENLKPGKLKAYTLKS